MAATSGAPLNAELLKASKIIPDVVDEVCEPFLDMRVIYRNQIEVACGLAMRVLMLFAEIWETGKEVVPYMGPTPPEGCHRYVFLLFKQVCFQSFFIFHIIL